MAFLVDAQDPAAGSPAPAPHPLAPLTAAEIEAAAAAVKAARGLGDTARFVYVSLYEPPSTRSSPSKRAVPAPDRLCKVVIRERAEHATYEGVVRLPDGEVVELPARSPASSRASCSKSSSPPRTSSARTRAGRRRCASAASTDFDLCMIDPWSTPNVEPGVGPDDGRFVSPLTWVRDDPDDNGYAHPVDGVRHPGRPGHADRRQRRRLRRPPDAAKKAQLLHGQDHRPGQHPVLPRRPAHGRQAVRHHPARGPELQPSTAST